MTWFGDLEDMTEVIRDTFGVAVFYTRASSGEVFTIEAVFDQSAEWMTGGGSSLPTTIRVPVLDVRIADIGGHEPEEDDEAVVGGVAYRVIDTADPSSGMMKARLRKK